MNPFEFVNSINTTKENLIVDDQSEKAYNPYLTNQSLSYFSDTVHIVNVLNRYHHLDKKLQYDFFTKYS
jgi:hypothetical protein